jgi:hypothetical protein
VVPSGRPPLLSPKRVRGDQIGFNRQAMIARRAPPLPEKLGPLAEYVALAA